eukprot:116273-Amphidinium_carterae.1
MKAATRHQINGARRDPWGGVCKRTPDHAPGHRRSGVQMSREELGRRRWRSPERSTGYPDQE